MLAISAARKKCLGVKFLSLRNLRPKIKEITESAHTQLEHWEPRKALQGAHGYKYQVIDFFSGCGGMSLGFSAVSKVIPGFKIIGGCDIDSDANKTFEANLGAPALQVDVRELARSSKSLNGFLAQLSDYDSSRPLVIIGCAPCQGFTSHRKKNWSQKDDRNALPHVFASLAVKLNPACIVMENVPEFFSHMHWNHFEETRKTLEKEGYFVRQTIYNAASFGVPQERFRALVIAMKRPFLLPSPMFGPNQYLTVHDAIGNLSEILPGETCKDDPLHKCANHKRSTLATIRAVPKNGGSRPFGVGPQCLDRVKGFYDVYGRLSWDKSSITITHYARNPASGRYIHPEQNRGLSIREASLLQSFPKNYNFIGSFDSIFKQIGEAVPPKFAAAVAVHALAELTSPPLSRTQLEKGIPPITSPVSNSYSSVIAGIKSSGMRNGLYLR